MRRRAWARSILITWIVLLAPAGPQFGQGGSEGAEERMVEIAVDLQDGFMADTVAISAEGRELFRDEGVRTRFQIGMARSVRLAVPEGRTTLTIDVPTRNASKAVPIDTSEPVFVGISLTTAGDLEVRVQNRPFGYL